MCVKEKRKIRTASKFVDIKILHFQESKSLSKKTKEIFCIKYRFFEVSMKLHSRKGDKIAKKMNYLFNLEIAFTRMKKVFDAI